MAVRYSWYALACVTYSTHSTFVIFFCHVWFSLCRRSSKKINCHHSFYSRAFADSKKHCSTPFRITIHIYTCNWSRHKNDLSFAFRVCGILWEPVCAITIIATCQLSAFMHGKLIAKPSNVVRNVHIIHIVAGDSSDALNLTTVNKNEIFSGMEWLYFHSILDFSF